MHTCKVKKTTTLISDTALYTYKFHINLPYFETLPWFSCFASPFFITNMAFQRANSWKVMFPRVSQDSRMFCACSSPAQLLFAFGSGGLEVGEGIWWLHPQSNRRFKSGKWPLLVSTLITPTEGPWAKAAKALPAPGALRCGGSLLRVCRKGQM